MTLHPIKAIFFDAAGTLFTVNGSVGDIYARLARDHGKDVAVADLELGFRRCFATAPPMAFPSASPERIPILEKQWWKTLVHDVFAPLGAFPRFGEYFDALFAFFAQAEAWRLYPETRATLETLTSRGFIVGVISNFDSRLFNILDGFGITRFFDPIVISTRAGAAKPEREIFTQALARAGVEAREALHIGDSYDADIIGARHAGLTPVLVERSGKPPKHEGQLTVSNLAELLPMLRP
ncbi:MAG: HAD-IA family hydrolase [Deltaproteobacteria bacterium]|nr:HAD-IA family hydrolase [Deltaproteobacteria bacterium]